jgi:hypothetical protein
VCLVGGWLALAYQIDPQHAFQQLWFNELYGRVTGMGPEGARGGPEAWLTGMPNHFAYYAVRFLPWSLCTLAAMYVLWRTRHNHQAAWVQASDTPLHAHEKLRDWMIAAVLFAWLVVVLFTLSAGKRADYIAAAFGPGSLLAACWLLRMSRAFAIRLSWAGPTAAVLTLIALTVENRMDAFAPVKDFGEIVNSFVAETNQAIANEPLPVFVVWADDAPVHALLGLPGNHVQYDALDAARARTKFWVIAGRKIREPHEFSMWLRERFAKAEIKTVVQSELLPKLDCWPEQLTLYLVDAQRKSRSKRAKASTAPAT